ncbi:MAG: tetratricopeptide repeat protein [Candidatus Melainabacteria bacterium]|nr:tetratricopeptide repeat protein [Candidatus Melainabacteria bacterium]
MFGTKAPSVMALLAMLIASTALSCQAESDQSEEAAVVAKAEGTKDRKKALVLLEKYLSMHPNAVNAVFNAARMANAAGLHQKTVQLATRYIELKKTAINPYIYHLRAHAYCCIDEPAKALADLAVAKKANPSDAEVYILIGDAQSGLKQYRKALEAFSSAAKLNEPSASLRKGNVEIALNDWHNAAADYAEYINRTGESGYPLAKVQDLLHKNQDEKALAFMDEMLRANIPKAEETLMVLRAHTLFKVGRYQDSLQACDAFEKKFKKTGLYTLKYQIVWNAKDYDKALVCLDGIIKSKPQDLTWFLRRGDCYRALDEYGKALADYNRVPELVMKSEQARRNRAECKYQLGHVQEALDELTAINTDSPSADGYARQGHYLTALKRYKDAVVCFSLAIKLKPLSSDLFCERGDCFRRLKEYPRALKDFSDAMTLNPNNKLIVYGRGLCYAEMGRSRDAIADFTAALANPNLTSRAFLERAKAYEQLGDKTSAENDRNAAKKATKSIEDDFYH